MRVVAIIQARWGSSRLRGKVLQPICGLPALAFMVARVRRSRLTDRVVIATSVEPSDDSVAELGHKIGVEVVRGSETDVLGRFALAARYAEASELVRLTGDCPLIDPEVIDAVIALRRAAGVDYAANTMPSTFPDGLDVEVFTREALLNADAHATRPSDREHVTSYLRDHPDLFTRANHAFVADFSHLRWTVDEAADLDFVRRLTARVGPAGAVRAGWLDYMAALTGAPDLLGINCHIPRNEGYAKSLAAEHDHDDPLPPAETTRYD